MGTGELSLFESGVWIIPLVLVGTIVGMYALILSWQKQTQQDLKSLQAELRNFQTKFKQFEIATQGFSVEDREPFGSDMRALAVQLDMLGRRVGLLHDRYVEIRETVGRLNKYRAQAMIGAPFFVFQWLGVRRSIGDLHKEIRRIKAEFNALQSSAGTLARRGWEAAEKVRRVVERERLVQGILERFAERHMQGDALEGAVSQELALRSSLEKIPRFFLEAGEEAVLQGAEKESVADVFEILGESGPAVEKLLEQVQGWEKQVKETDEKVAGLRKTLGEVGDLIPTMPPELIVDPFETRLQQLNTISDSLQATLLRLEIESIPEVDRETERVRSAAMDMVDQLRRARRQMVALERILEELVAGLKTLSTQFTELGRSDVHPVSWSQSRSRFSELSRQASAVGTYKKPRLPEQVDKDLAAASALLSQQKELARHFQTIAGQHAELLKLLESDELKGGSEWFRIAGSTAAQVALYDPENWPRADSAGSLTADLETLLERHRRLLAGDPAGPIPEGELAQEVEGFRALTAQHQAMRGRLDRMKNRLAELQEIEKTLRDRYQEARTVLGQVELLARSNDFLNENAMAEIGSFRSQLEQRGSDLAQRRQGLVEEKARGLNGLISQIETSANSWLDRLNGDIEAKKASLAGKLDTLLEIAALDERAVQEAQGLLSHDSPNTAAQRSKARPSFGLNEIVAQMKPRSDTWQACIAALRAIEDIEKPLVETYQNTLEQYESTKAQLASAAKWLSGRRSWPPTSVTVEAEIKEFGNIESQWQELESQPNRAINVVRRLSDLSTRLQSLSERAGQKVARAEQEQARIQDLEGDLEELTRRWQALGQEYPEAVGEIRGFNAQIGRDVETLKRQYKQGSIAYNQVLQSLNLLCQNVQNEQITLNNGQTLRLGGDGYYRRRY